MTASCRPNPSTATDPTPANESGLEIQVPLRTYNTYPEAGHDWIEENNHYSEAVVGIPIRQAALVLVDVWDFHPNKSNMERGMRITRSRIVPLLPRARAAGLTVVHAPDLNVARKYPQWGTYARPEDEDGTGTYPRWGHLRWDKPPGGGGEAPSASQPWPPREFQQRVGEYARFHRPVGPVAEYALAHPPDRRIDPAVELDDRDVIIGRGVELQRLCAERGILHLIYAGFATNMCLQYKDYGVRAFANRGYNVVLVRDATTAMESHDTVANEDGTLQAVRELEMEVLATTTSDALLNAFDAVDPRGGTQR
jgi:nicotinamidase-related amidase